jgi:hypothetical protein
MEKNCMTCAHNECEKVGDKTVCHCAKTGAYIGSEAMKEHWCGKWEDYRNERNSF